MFFTQKDAEAAAKAIGLDFSAEKFTVDDLLAGMNAELRHGTKAGSANVTNDDPTMTAKLAVSNLRVSPSYYSQRVGKSAWERSLAKGVQHRCQAGVHVAGHYMDDYYIVLPKDVEQPFGERVGIKPSQPGSLALQGFRAFAAHSTLCQRAQRRFFV